MARLIANSPSVRTFSGSEYLFERFDMPEIASKRPVSWETANGYKGAVPAELAWQTSFPVAGPCEGSGSGHGSVRPLLENMRPPGIVRAEAVPDR